MSTVLERKTAPESQYTGIVDRTVRAYTIAEHAAAAVADCLVSCGTACCSVVQQDEQELDRLDREMDACVANAISGVTPAQARELLSSVMMVVDLERIGDLLASVAGCARALDKRLRQDDITDLVKMATMLENMLANAHGAFIVRNVDRAVSVLRADADMDRRRNIILSRHLELAQSHGTQDTILVLFMAQALERAGDHVKNLAEEVCHLATGHSIRHALCSVDKHCEQMSLEQLSCHQEITVIAAGAKARPE